MGTVHYEANGIQVKTFYGGLVRGTMIAIYFKGGQAELTRDEATEFAEGIWKAVQLTLATSKGQD